MKLVVNKNLANNNYEVLLDVVDVEQADKELFSDFGELIINTGGSITEEVTTTEEQQVEVSDGAGGTTTETRQVEVTRTVTVAEISNAYRKFPSELPIKRVFTKAEFGLNAEKIAKLYADKIEKDLKLALSVLREKKDTFTAVEEILL